MEEKKRTALRIILNDLKTVKIPLPPTLEEQQKIDEILSKWDEVIEMKKAKKGKLERMKKKESYGITTYWEVRVKSKIVSKRC